MIPNSPSLSLNVVATETLSKTASTVAKGIFTGFSKLLTRLGLNAAADAVLAVSTGGVGTAVKWGVQIVLWGGGAIIKPIARGLRALFGAGLGIDAATEWARSTFGGPRAPQQPWYKQMTIVGPLVLVGTMLLLTMFLPICAARFPASTSPDTPLPGTDQVTNNIKYRMFRPHSG